MKLELYGKNYNPSDSLRAITEKKCAKLERRLSDDDEAQVKFTVTFENDRYSTDLTVVTRGQTYRAEAEADNPFDNVDIVIPRLLGQMKKQKDIRERSKKGEAKIYGDAEN